MSEPKMGGKPVLRLFLAGGDDVNNSLLSIEDGGNKLSLGLRELVHEKYPMEYKVEFVREDQTQELSSANDAEFPSQLIGEPLDVVVLSIQADVNGSIPADQFEGKLLRLIQAVKQRVGAHVIVYNCSSVDLSDNIHNYFGRPDTFSVRVHRFNLALMRLSTLEGISIIDVERLVGQLAGERHVTAPLNYSVETYEAMCQEFLRVLEDIGFFEKRPLVLQIGQRRK